MRQILLESILKFVQRTVWRICILTLGAEGLSEVERRYTVGYLTDIATFKTSSYLTYLEYPCNTAIIAIL